MRERLQDDGRPDRGRDAFTQRPARGIGENLDCPVRKIITMLFEAIQRAYVRMNVLGQGLDQQPLIPALMPCSGDAKEPEVRRVTRQLRHRLSTNNAVIAPRAEAKTTSRPMTSIQ